MKENNEREWFQPRKEEFERLLRDPMMAAVAKVNTALEAKAPEYVTDPQKSIYRIYRDTRFSPNKTPYKTHLGALLHHRKLGKDSGAVIYFHVSTDAFLIAFGLYMMPTELLTHVRAHIADHHKDLESILRKKQVKELFDTMQGDKLTRPPKGYPAGHPAIEYLKHKNFLLEASMPAEEATTANAVSLVQKHVLAAIPFIEYLNKPLLTALRKRDPLLTGN
ncbi:MAG: DUF2461 domain-containing protein [Bryobacteraceae bacterium]|nr:DUF2461 domain-containing protein [Bryobacteraceae bacterium]